MVDGDAEPRPRVVLPDALLVSARVDAEDMLHPRTVDDYPAMWAGESVEVVKDIRPAGETVRTLAAERRAPKSFEPRRSFSAVPFV